MSGRIVPEFRNETLRELIEGHYRIIYKMNSDFVAIHPISETKINFES